MKKEIEYYRKIILTKCKNADDISYFEASTLIAIMFFADHINPNGYCLFEVGLGGRLDATNIFDKPLACAITSISLDHIDKFDKPLACAITSISLDHIDKLGNTLEI